MEGEKGKMIQRHWVDKESNVENRDAFCLDVARVKVKHRETLNICIAFPRTEQLRGVT